jgi:hypothetical protein
MGGEYMLRKPARMALQAAYGPDFLDSLNQADAWLGSGSRGNAASHRRPGVSGRYAGGGILNSIGSWLGTAVGDLEKGAEAAWSGISGIAGEVAKFGEKAAFDALWSTTALPAEKAMEALGTPGAMGAAWLQDVHTGVSNYINGQTAKAQTAQAAANISAAGVSNASAEMALASAANKMGWGGSEWQALFDVEMREAGFSLTAQNPTSGAYGMAQFINGPSEYAQYGGNSTTAAGQAVAMVNYIKQRYGDPIAAWAHEQAFGWYATGGPVISAIKSATSNIQQQQAMALGAYLLSKWDTTASVPAAYEYGPWLIPTNRHKGLTIAGAETPATAARLVAPYYARGAMNSTPDEWKNAPAAAAMYATAYASTAAGTSFSQPGTAALDDAWQMVISTLDPAAPTIGSTSTVNQADIKGWQTYGPKIHPDWQAAWNAWNPIWTMTRPRSAPASAWNAFQAQRAALGKAEVAAGSSVTNIFGNATSPQNLNPHAWSTALTNMAAYTAAMQGSAFTAKYDPAGWTAAVKSAQALDSDLKSAANAWTGVWGTYVVPGVPVQSPGSAPPVTVDLNSLILGAPSPQQAGTTGFAAGGSLSDVAAMFAGGMAAGGMVPGLVLPGLSATLQRQLAGAAAGQQPRTLSDAAGDTVGLQIGNLTINNPVPERPSDSITRSSNRLAFMAGRGIV